MVNIKIENDEVEMAEMAELLFIRRDGTTHIREYLDMNNHTFTGVRLPKAMGEAATKKYVDVANGSDGGGEDNDGGSHITYTRDLDLNGFRLYNPKFVKDDIDFVTKKYLDNNIIPLVGVKLSDDLQVSQQSIFVNDPEDDKDLVNLKWVNNNLLSKQGGSLNNDIIFQKGNKFINVAHPTQPLHTSTKKFVDDIVEQHLHSSNKMEGDINMNKNEIVSLKEPIKPNDAATFTYLTTRLADPTAPIQINTSSHDISGLKLPTAPHHGVSKKHVGDILLLKTSQKVPFDFNMNNNHMKTLTNTFYSPSSLLNKKTFLDHINIDNMLIHIKQNSGIHRELDMNTFRISSLDDPVSDNDAMNLKYAQKYFV